MKHGLLFFLFFFNQSAFALYGKHIEKANEEFVVSLHLEDSDNPEYDFFCNGVLISPNKVITAGHCIDSLGGDVYSMSHALIYHPYRLQVKVGAKRIRARYVTLSPMYFEGITMSAEDLALIELESQVKNVRPIKIAPRIRIFESKRVTLIARNFKVETSRLQFKKYGTAEVLFLGSEAGACLGDSGGAVVINENGQQMLAGVLMYSGEKKCVRKIGYSFYPKAQF